MQLAPSLILLEENAQNHNVFMETPFTFFKS